MDDILSNIRTKSEAKEVIACLDDFSFTLFSTKEKEDKEAHFSRLHSDLAKALISVLGVGAVTENSREKVKEQIQQIQEAVRKCETIQMTIAFQPDDATILTFSSWIKENVGKQFLLDIQVDKTAIGGAAIVANGLFKDFSLRKKVASTFQLKKDKILGAMVN